MLWRVRFCITGYHETEAGRDPDEVYEIAQNLSLRDLVDKPSATVDFDIPECQE